MTPTLPEILRGNFMCLAVPPTADMAGDYMTARITVIALLNLLAAQEAERGELAATVENAAIAALLADAREAGYPVAPMSAARRARRGGARRPQRRTAPRADRAPPRRRDRARPIVRSADFGTVPRDGGGAASGHAGAARGVGGDPRFRHPRAGGDPYPPTVLAGLQGQPVWIPACAGMTMMGDLPPNTSSCRHESGMTVRVWRTKRPRAPPNTTPNIRPAPGIDLALL